MQGAGGKIKKDTRNLSCNKEQTKQMKKVPGLRENRTEYSNNNEYMKTWKSDENSRKVSKNLT